MATLTQEEGSPCKDKFTITDKMDIESVCLHLYFHSTYDKLEHENNKLIYKSGG